MNFAPGQLKDQFSNNKLDQYQDKEEEEEEDQEEEENDHITRLNNLPPFCADPSSTSSSSSDPFKKWPPQQFTGNNNLQLMDYLSLKPTSFHGGGESSNGNNNIIPMGGPEREHMFDKVVTPSDVGKLNRLVIPKQHAEKYFPLDSASNEKGLLLNFEDRGGKSWRFRYSYWNSSQSYVMTKGWSRFVKEKKLDAGDIVSFQRETAPHHHGGSGTRLFIDWRRRAHHHHQFHHLLSSPAASLTALPIDYHNHNRNQNNYLQPFHSLPLSMSMSMPIAQPPRFQYPIFEYNHNHHYHHHHHHQYQYQLQDHHQDYMINYSTPQAAAAGVGPAGAGATKRLRLFGVNMEYRTPNEEAADQASLDSHDDHRSSVSNSSSVIKYDPLQVRLPTHNNSSPMLPLLTTLPRPASFPAEFSQYKGKSTNNSLSFDLDIP